MDYSKSGHQTPSWVFPLYFPPKIYTIYITNTYNSFMCSISHDFYLGWPSIWDEPV